MFMVYSAATVTGLNSALLGDMTTWQQVILFVSDQNRLKLLALANLALRY